MSHEKIVFLDCDGVVNSADYFERVKGTRPDPTNEDEMFAGCVDPEAVKLLDEILERTGAKVVVSSTWRLCHEGFGFITRALHWGSKNQGGPGLIHHRSFIDVTGSEGRVRGNQIDAWLKAHPGVKSFVILDDDSDMEPHMDKLVQTSWKHGLQREHVEQAVKMLGEKKLSALPLFKFEVP